MRSMPVNKSFVHANILLVHSSRSFIGVTTCTGIGELLNAAPFSYTSSKLREAVSIKVSTPASNARERD